MNQTLPQQLYLLCCTVEEGKFEVVNLQGRGQLLRAAALTELPLDGLLTTDGGKVARRAAKPPSRRAAEPPSRRAAERWFPRRGVA
ncbi:GPP34 family phosphoprotein [Streptomyces sp. NPDC050161]|uniref:GPP34 family phosphoprotein n=1 Tax=Streptomyces sp. NPDC050161 TaxID=3365604 RepID=UPI00378FF31D